MSEGWSDSWWFWAAAAALLAAAGASSGAYRSLAAGARRWASHRGLVRLPPGQLLEQGRPGFWSDLSWVGYPLGGWIVLGPWIWGYAEADGALAADVSTGAVVIAVAAAGILFPALWALSLIAGLWLVTAPWLVGYGDVNGPVGLSDSIAGLLVCAAAVTSLVAAERRIGRGDPGAIGRIRRRD